MPVTPTSGPPPPVSGPPAPVSGPPPPVSGPPAPVWSLGDTSCRSASKPGRGRAEGGSALLLMPAAVLVLIVLGAIAVDFSIAFLAQREVADATAAAANDAASAIDEDAYRSSGELRLDLARAQGVAQAAYDARRATYLQSQPVDVREVPCDDEPAVVCVEVRARASVGYVFSKAIPGAPNSASVGAVSTAELQPAP